MKENYLSYMNKVSNYLKLNLNSKKAQVTWIKILIPLIILVILMVIIMNARDDSISLIDKLKDLLFP